MEKTELELTIRDFRGFTAGKTYKTIYADPPWQFQNRTGKVAPEHKRLTRYGTMKLDEIKQLPVSEVADDKSHLYLWVPNALLPEGLEVMRAWGFEYKTNIIWEKVRKDGMPDGLSLIHISVEAVSCYFAGFRRGGGGRRRLLCGDERTVRPVSRKSL